MASETEPRKLVALHEETRAIAENALREKEHEEDEKKADFTINAVYLVA